MNRRFSAAVGRVFKAFFLDTLISCQDVEQNFGFLKDPVIANSIFLKKPSRIDVLGLVLLIALIIWRVMERCMRQYLEKTKSKISGCIRILDMRKDRKNVLNSGAPADIGLLL